MSTMDKPTILIVDDKPEIAKVIKIQMSLDYNVFYMENPVKGIAWMHEGNIPDLIISDYFMPEMNGHEFLTYLKSSEIFKNIPIIVLSSIEISAERINLVEVGANVFIVKPFNPQELIIRVRNILRRY